MGRALPETRRRNSREWHARNREKSRAFCRATQLKTKYGLTVAEYETMVAAQGGLCAICRRPEKSKFRGKLRRLAVDHDHATGRVRALLCDHCNVALGFLEENPELLQSAIMYLAAHKQVPHGEQ